MRALSLLLLLVGCEETPEGAPATPETTAVVEAAEEAVEEPDERETEEVATPTNESPPNFLTTYQCLRTQRSCELRLEALAGIQRIDLGSGHGEPPSLELELETESGYALIGELRAEPDAPTQGHVTGRARRSLLGQAYFLGLSGQAEGVVLRLRYDRTE